MKKLLKNWSGSQDKHRVYEAAYLGPILKSKRIRHVHAHFAGMASRTAYWIKKFYGITYSFTGHANDIFCETDFPVTLEDLIRESAFVATETDFSREWLQKKYPGFSAKIHRVYNGIHLEGFPNATSDGKTSNIISVGRYIEKKGFEDLIDACRILKERGQTFQCQIIGEGPLEAALQARIDQQLLTGTVKLMGPKPQEEVRNLLAQANLFVLACVVESNGGMDNLPTVIMEAMACGLPVVSTSTAGVTEMISDGMNGFLVEQKNPPALAAAMEKILKNSELARTFGQRGRDIAISKFATQTTTRALKELLVRYCAVDPGFPSPKNDPNLISQLFQWLLQRKKKRE